MPISVHCESCGQTYQFRSDMAGRKGKCPQGHSIRVPAPYATPAAGESSELDFSAMSSSADRPAARSSKPARRPEPEPAPEPGDAEDSGLVFPSRDDLPALRKPARQAQSRPADPPPATEDEFTFPTAAPPVDDEPPPPKAGRSRSGYHKAAGREATGARKSMMPLLIGGILAVLGIGGGMAMFFVARSEVNPLRDQLAEANRKAEQAEQRAKSAEAAVAIADAALTSQKKNPAPPPAAKTDSTSKSALDKASAAERKLAELERKLADLEAARPPADPLAPPKMEAPAKAAAPEAPAGGPAGGKNWSAPISVLGAQTTFKAGDRITIRPKEDAVVKAVGGELKIKFRWQLQPGKELPAEPYGTLLIRQPGSIVTTSSRVNLTGAGGEAEASFPVKGVTGAAMIDFFVSDDNFGGGGKKLAVFSTIISTSAEF